MNSFVPLRTRKLSPSLLGLATYWQLASLTHGLRSAPQLAEDASYSESAMAAASVDLEVTMLRMSLTSVVHPFAAGQATQDRDSQATLMQAAAHAMRHEPKWVTGCRVPDS
jgi:hypothetical protein